MASNPAPETKPKNNRAFYLRMRLTHHHHHRQISRPPGGFHRHLLHFFRRNTKFIIIVLSFSLLLSLFSSPLRRHPPAPPPPPLSLSQSTFSHHHNPTISSSSHALFESSSIPTQKPKHSSNSAFHFKLFVYDLPPRYNAVWLSDPRCDHHLFASEVAIHRALMSAPFRTLDPYDADFFFVPVYVSCNFSKINGFPAIGHARGLISSAVDLLSSALPFWNRSSGSDHVFVASHDFGACFHTMEDSAMADGIPKILRNSIILQTFGVKGRHPCQEANHVVIPPYISPETIRSTLQNSPLNVHRRRDIFAFFRGKMEVHPKNVSGRFYSKAVRTKIWNTYNNDRRFYLRRHRYAGYQSEMARSVFCLCPLGWAPWSPRIVESVALGCVPVIIADGIRLPFEDAIRWADISLTVAEEDVGKLGRILDHVARTNLTVIQNNLRDPAVRRALLFYDEMEDGDATWHVMRALEHEIDRSRSRRRSLVRDQ